MNALEANLLLTRAALTDPFLVPDADRAEAWADVLPDLPLDAALVALRRFRRERPGVRLEPGHLLELAGMVDDPPSKFPDVTPEVVAESKARALAAAGVSEAEFAAHSDDAEWVAAVFDGIDLDATPIPVWFEPKAISE